MLARVAALDRHRHAVGDLEHTGRTSECRHEDVRAVDVGARVVVDAFRRDVERSAALGVQHAAEHRRRVEAREARPVDRAVAPDERGRVAVADQRVVADAVQRHASSGGALAVGD